MVVNDIFLTHTRLHRMRLLETVLLPVRGAGRHTAAISGVRSRPVNLEIPALGRRRYIEQTGDVYPLPWPIFQHWHVNVTKRRFESWRRWCSVWWRIAERYPYRTILSSCIERNGIPIIGRRDGSSRQLPGGVIDGIKPHPWREAHYEPTWGKPNIM